MSLTGEETQGQTCLKIEGALSVYEVAELREKILAYLEKNKELILDLDEVTECDTAGIQLLYSARKTAEEEGKTFTVTSASDPVFEAITRIGLVSSDVLNLGG